MNIEQAKKFNRDLLEKFVAEINKLGFSFTTENKEDEQILEELEAQSFEIFFKWYSGDEARSRYKQAQYDKANGWILRLIDFLIVKYKISLESH